MVGLCAEMCEHDGNCSANQKCCSNGCGHTCVDSVQSGETRFTLIRLLGWKFILINSTSHELVIQLYIKHHNSMFWLCWKIATTSTIISIYWFSILLVTILLQWFIWCIITLSHLNPFWYDLMHVLLIISLSFQQCQLASFNSNLNNSHFSKSHTTYNKGFLYHVVGFMLIIIMFYIWRYKGTIKPGTCPAPSKSSDGICTNSCQNDASCPTKQKCCSNGCGRACVVPETEGTFDYDVLISWISGCYTNNYLVIFSYPHFHFGLNCFLSMFSSFYFGLHLIILIP